MSPRSASAAGILVTLVAATAIAFSVDSAADYPSQVGPAVRALAKGDLAGFIDHQPVYGSFSALVRAPLAAVAIHLGGDELLVYRLGALICLLALGLLGTYLARLMASRGQPPLVCIAACALTLLNPATLAAVENGHPEELLAAALVVGAVLAAIQNSGVWAGVLLGLALATKQWALLAVLPVLLVSMGAGRARVALVAVAVAAALTLPLAVASPETFSGNARSTSGAAATASRFSVWWPLSSARREVVFVGEEARTVTRHRLPRRLAGTARPLVVLLSVILAYLYVRRRHGRALEDVLGLLALVLLLRCVLDPVNNAYYHVPFLLSLLAWEGLRFSGLPVLTLLSGAALWATFHDPLLAQPAVGNAFYLGWTFGLVSWLALSIYPAASPPRAAASLLSRRRLTLPAARPRLHTSNT